MSCKNVWNEIYDEKCHEYVYVSSFEGHLMSSEGRLMVIWGVIEGVIYVSFEGYLCVICGLFDVFRW